MTATLVVALISLAVVIGGLILAAFVVLGRKKVRADVDKETIESYQRAVAARDIRIGDLELRVSVAEVEQRAANDKIEFLTNMVTAKADIAALRALSVAHHESEMTATRSVGDALAEHRKKSEATLADLLKLAGQKREAS